MSLLTALSSSTEAKSNPSTFTPFSIPGTSETAYEALQLRVRRLYFFCQTCLETIIGSPGHVVYLDFSQKNISLSQNNQSPYLRKIKITFYTSQNNRSGYKIKFETDDGAFETYKIPPNNFMIPHKYFDGSEYERSYSRKQLNKPIIRNERWSCWERSYPTAFKFYLKHIYPKISCAVDQLTALRAQEKVKILDLGGGSGRLAVKLLKNLRHRIEKINLVDGNATLIKNATRLASQGLCQIVPHHLDITATEFPPEEFFRSFDIIILCGVVATQVLTQEQSLNVIEKSFGMLRPAGHLIVTSFSTPWLRAKDYKKIAPECNILNTAFRFQEDKIWHFKGFYVIQNKID